MCRVSPLAPVPPGAPHAFFSAPRPFPRGPGLFQAAAAKSRFAWGASSKSGLDQRMLGANPKHDQWDWHIYMYLHTQIPFH